MSNPNNESARRDYGQNPELHYEKLTQKRNIYVAIQRKLFNFQIYKKILLNFYVSKVQVLIYLNCKKAVFSAANC